MSTRFPQATLRVGLVLIGLSLVLFAALAVTSSWEQSRSPGEKNMGVAVLGITFGLPMVICAAAGAVSLLISGTAFAYQRLLRRETPTPRVSLKR